MKVKRLVTNTASQRILCPIGRRIRVLSVIASVTVAADFDQARIIYQTDAATQFVVVGTGQLALTTNTLAAAIGTGTTLIEQDGGVALPSTIWTGSLPDFSFDTDIVITLTGATVATLVLCYEESEA